MSKKDRGFASMDPELLRKIASLGGKAAHAKGTAHEWNKEEASIAGRKGGINSHKNKRDYKKAMDAAGRAVDIITRGY